MDEIIRAILVLIDELIRVLFSPVTLCQVITVLDTVCPNKTENKIFRGGHV